MDTQRFRLSMELPLRKKPGFISDTQFITGLEAAEKKSPVAAYMSTVSVAKTNLKSALEVAAIVNNYKKSSCKVRGIHFYGLSDRVFGKGRSAIEIPAEQLLHDIKVPPVCDWRNFG